MTPSLLDHHDVRSSFDLLAAWIEAQVAYRGWPGLSIAVVHDQEVIWSRGFGWADVERSQRPSPTRKNGAHANGCAKYAVGPWARCINASMP